MKIIFLDIDGVLALQSQFTLNRKKFHSKHPDAEALRIPYPFDKRAVDVFNKILDATDATIVISSDWRRRWSLVELDAIFKFNGVKKSPEFATLFLEDFDKESAGLFAWKGWLERIRCLEIKHFLSEHPEVTHWVAIDDLNMSNEFLKPGLDNFVLTPRCSEGIKQTGLTKQILKFFTKC